MYDVYEYFMSIIIILVFAIIGFIIIEVTMSPALSPVNAFDNDDTLMGYCYMNITDVGTQFIERNMEIRADKIYTYHKECVDRELNITSVGDKLIMEVKQFESHAKQGKVYIKTSINNTTESKNTLIK
jgi:hypothetical protein